MNRKIPMVMIELKDHNSRAEWIDSAELAKCEALPVYAVGFLIRETKDDYVLAGQITAEGHFGDTFCIVKKAVKSKRRLK